MITKLTKEQETKLVEYKEKWIKRGLCTDPVDKKKAIKICNNIQTQLLCRKATPVIVMRNPLEAWIAVCMFSNLVQVEAQVRDQVRAQVRDQVRDQVGAQVRAQVEAQVGAQVWAQVGDQVRDQVWDQVEAQVGAQVRAQVRAQVGDQVRDQVWDFITPFLCGIFDCACFSYYSFMREVLLLNSNLWEKFKLFENTYELGYIYPLEDICIVCDRPKTINIIDGKLHNDGGPSIVYEGNFKVWSLNGVRVPQYLAETPSGQLDIGFFKKEKNADIRTEFIRKYGIERMKGMGKKIDDYNRYTDPMWIASEYELWDMQNIFEGDTPAPYLSMLNQTTGVYHFEGIHPNCKNLKEAIKWRCRGDDLIMINIK